MKRPATTRPLPVRGRTLAVVLAVVAVAGCSSPPRACTEIGAANGVQVTVEGLATTDGQRGVSVEVRLAGSCGIQPLLADTSSVFVDLPALRSTADTDLAVTVRTTQGTVLMGSPHVPATPRKVQPNGPGCEPTAYQAQVTMRIPGEPLSPPSGPTTS